MYHKFLYFAHQMIGVHAHTRPIACTMAWPSVDEIVMMLDYVARDYFVFVDHADHLIKFTYEHNQQQQQLKNSPPPRFIFLRFKL